MAYTASKLIALAKAEVGYLEKKSNSNLDSKTGNAGSNNWTKYARDLYKVGYYNGNKNGYAWCDVFVDWCFYQLCNKDAKKAEAMICQTGDYGAGCTQSAQYYKNKGRLFKEPKPGDQIFFYNSSKSAVAHTGIVIAVDKTYVYTVEGNTSGASGIIANGGGVCEKKYKLTNSRIYRYGRPYYDEEPVDAEPSAPVVTETANKTETKTETTKKVDTVDITLNVLNKGDKGEQVKALQRMLHCMGYNLGANPIDGSFGTKTEAAVEKYQKKNGLTVDGSVGEKTWIKLLKG